MKRIISFMFLSLAAVNSHAASLNIFACEPEWASLSTELGGDKVKVYAATVAQQDPHHIEARPSLIAKVRRADLVVCTGADLEIGWLPMLLRQSGNRDVQSGQGNFMASDFVEKLEVPQVVDRSMGDMHPGGNPHIHLDPHRIAVIAVKLSERFQSLDNDHADYYKKRFQDFSARWNKAIANWEQKAAPLKGKRIVTHHKDFIYLIDWLGMEEVANLEPKPGIPATAGHLAGLKKLLKQTPAKIIIRTPYQDDRAGEWLSTQMHIPVEVMPYTVGGSEKAKDLFGLFDDTLDKLLSAMR